MGGSGANTVGRTLARLALLANPWQRPGLPPESRQQILAIIKEARSPVGVEYLCQQTKLHANTVRGHLDVLMAAGQIQRQPGPSSGRGRPPMLYRVASPPPLYGELVAALNDEMGAGSGQDLVEQAAQQWAAASDEDTTAVSPAEAVAKSAMALTRLGFQAQVGPVGDTITLARCPYADLIADQPGICEIHTALLRELIRRTGQPVTLERMEVWSDVGVCRARLIRPDLKPLRIIQTPTKTEPKSGRKGRQ